MTRDEFNVLADEYYSVMDIGEEKIQKREDDAWELFELFILLFYYFEEVKNSELEDYTFILPRVQNDLQDVVANIADIDDYMINYIAMLSLGVYTTTREHINDDYYLSSARAVNLALNESNSINNHLDLKEAQKQGYKFKIWHSKEDNRVRETHVLMDKVKKPIDDYFLFPDCKGLFPHDYVNMTPEETSNCRCYLEYAKE